MSKQIYVQDYIFDFEVIPPTWSGIYLVFLVVDLTTLNFSSLWQLSFRLEFLEIANLQELSVPE